MYCQSIKYYDSSHCIIQKKYYYSNKCYYSNKYYENKKSIVKSEKYFCCFWRAIGSGAYGKFVSGAKVLAAVPSISQPRRVYCELHGNKDRLEYGGEAVVSEDLNTEFWKNFF